MAGTDGKSSLWGGEWIWEECVIHSEGCCWPAGSRHSPMTCRSKRLEGKQAHPTMLFVLYPFVTYVSLHQQPHLLQPHMPPTVSTRNLFSRPAMATFRPTISYLLSIEEMVPSLAPMLLSRTLSSCLPTPQPFTSPSHGMTILTAIKWMPVPRIALNPLHTHVTPQQHLGYELPSYPLHFPDEETETHSS